MNVNENVQAVLEGPIQNLVDVVQCAVRATNVGACVNEDYMYVSCMYGMYHYKIIIM
jgi:hypothetical protein